MKSDACGVPLPLSVCLQLAQIFDNSVGITGNSDPAVKWVFSLTPWWSLRSNHIAGQVELAELDGPFVKISLKGRFWHKRSTVLARVGNYLKQRIPVSHFAEVLLLETYWHLHRSYFLRKQLLEDRELSPWHLVMFSCCSVARKSWR